MKYPILALISIGNHPNNRVSPLCDFSVKIERFQIISNVLNLKFTLLIWTLMKMTQIVFRLMSNQKYSIVHESISKFI